MNAPLKTTAEAATDFVRRHIGPSPRDISAMLDSVCAANPPIEVHIESAKTGMRSRSSGNIGTTSATWRRT